MEENRNGCRLGLDDRGRNYGVDLLKILTMILVICCHLLSHGGCLSAAEPFSLRYEVLNLLYSAAMPCVNIYMMITGFLYHNRRTRLETLIGLWTEAAFFAILAPAVLKAAGAEIGTKEIVKGLFPVITVQSWFFTAYFALFFLIPALNRIVDQRRLACTTLAGALFCFSLLQSLAHDYDLFGLGGGYSLLWMIMMYLCGAFIGRYGAPAWLTQRRAALLLTLSICMTLSANNILCFLHDTPVGALWPRNFFYNHTSPTILLSAFCMICLFTRMEIRPEAIRRALPTLAACTFGVYLLHDNGFVRDMLIVGRFAVLTERSAFSMILLLLLSALLIFAACTAVDLLRDRLFRALGVPRLAKKLARLVESCFTKILP